MRMGQNIITKEYVALHRAKQNPDLFRIVEVKLPKIKQMERKRGGWSEWVFPQGNYLFQCCDCSLIHEMQFKAFVEKDRKRGTFGVVALPDPIRAMFRARRLKAKTTNK